MSKINDGGQAFPQTVKHWNDHLSAGASGMSLRDWFAGQAMLGMLPGSSASEEAAIPLMMQTLSAFSYQMADAMLAERAKGEAK